MLTLLTVKLLCRIRSAFWLHFLYYSVPFVLALLLALLSLNFGSRTQLLRSLQSAQGIAACIILVVTVTGFIRFLYYHCLNGLYNASVLNDSYGTSTNVGQPGDGKSSVSAYDAFLNARYAWAELQKEYYLCVLRLPEWQASEDEKKLEHFREVSEAYELYMSNISECIPCLHSNITFTDRAGRRAYLLPPDVYEQLIRLPYMAVCFIDEIGQEPKLNVDTIKHSRNLRVSHFFRFIRQFTGGKLFATEQDPKNIYIDVRRNAKNRYMLGQHSALKPGYLGFVYRLFLRLGMHYGIDNPLFVRFLFELRHLHTEMGYRVFRYVLVGNTELGSYGKNTIVTRAIPYYTDFVYDDRYFRCKYLAKDIPSYIYEFISRTPSSCRDSQAQGDKNRV